MRKRGWIVLSVCAVAAAVVAVGWWTRADAANGRRPRPLETRADPVAQLTRLQLDVFELTCTHAQLAGFELDAIGTGAPDTTQLLDRLGQLGAARLLLRYDNVVDFAEETQIRSGLQVPAVKNVTISSNGNIVPSINFEDVGFRIAISGAWLDGDDPMQARVRFHLSCSDLSGRELRVADGVTVPIFTQRLATDEIRVLRSQEPTWFACNQMQLAGDEDSTTHMTLVRLTATRLTDWQ